MVESLLAFIATLAGDTACELACLEDVRDECEHNVAISWVINDQKTAIDGADLVIEDNTLPRTEDGVDHRSGGQAL